jgi:AcrR family transcriptional regulator
MIVREIQAHFGRPWKLCDFSDPGGLRHCSKFASHTRQHHVKAVHMSWRKEHSRAERGYHHGNLKEALLRAALDLIAEKGAAGFTFADAARMAGVSPAAPYRHFRDRDELLSSIAQRGFEQFEAVLTSAWDDGRPDTITAFERVGKAYLAFAREEPAFYSAMFESGVPFDGNLTLAAASERAFGIVRAAAERLAALAPPGTPRPPALMMALHIWSMSHGVASLFARGDAARRKLPMSAEDLLEAEVLIYLRGLGFPTDRRPSGQKDGADRAQVNPAATGPWGTRK